MGNVRAVKLEDFRELWTNPAQKYVLVRLPESRRPDDLLIYDREATSAVLIDDDELDAAVVRRMIEEGVAILDHLP